MDGALRLILSTRHPRNSTYSTESGQVLYKVNKPHNLGSGIATIMKAAHTVDGVWLADSAPTLRVPGDQNNNSRRGHHRLEGGPNTNTSSTLEGHFAFLAQIEFHVFRSSRFLFNGQDIPVSSYFRKKGWSYYGRGRVFTAANGKEYRWRMGAWTLELITNDEQKLQVVRFHPYHSGLGPLRKKRLAYLEIHPSCEGILDEILMTFIYIHKLQKDRKRASQMGEGDGGDGGGGE